MCEIPIEAYRHAGVRLPKGTASMVTMDDVDRASNDWDAMGILHDIDTQWGAIPGGGAYSDSNDYFGSGDYDYY